MYKTKLYITLLVIQLLIGVKLTFAQVQNDGLATDSVHKLNGIINYEDIYNTKWITIGSQYDFFSSTLGLKISNGYDERPLIHFEDFSENFVFKLQGNANFEEDFSYGINLGWKHIRYLSLISIGFYNYDYPTRDFQFQDLNISAETYIKKTDFNIVLKLASQNLNSKKNIGAELGISNVFIYRKLYAGLFSGYYFDYFTYSGFIQSFIYKDIIGLKLNYQRIDRYDFLKLGLNFTFKR